MASSRKVEAAFGGQSVELGTTTTTNGTNGTNHSKTQGTSGSPHRHATPGKATILAIGRAVPSNTTKNDGLADHYIQQFQLQDPIVQAKLRRLCKPPNPSPLSQFPLLTTTNLPPLPHLAGETTTVKTRYLVVNKEILDEHPEFLIEGAATVSQRLAITGMLTYPHEYHMVIT
jgi:hypothetical protein